MASEHQIYRNPPNEDVSITRRTSSTVIPINDWLGGILPSDLETQMCYISFANMRLNEWIPAIPAPFKQAALEDRALYVIGIPHDWHMSFTRRLFEVHGTVEACPCVIDVVAQNTFRWVIMKNKQQASIAAQSYHDFEMDGIIIWTCWALPPGPNFDLAAAHQERLKHDVAYAALMKTKELLWQAKAIDVPATLNPKSRKLGIPWSRKLGQTQLSHVASLLDSSGESLKYQQHQSTEEPPLNMPQSNARLDTNHTQEQVMETARHEATGAANDLGSKAGSWANIASSGAGDIKTIDLQSETRSKATGTGKVPGVEPLIQQMRVVLILGIPASATLNDISDAVREGALASIKFGYDADKRSRFVGIVFQHAQNAEQFYQVIARERRLSRPSRLRFTPGAVVRGDPFPLNAALRAMSDPTVHATRRLTVVKRAIFTTLSEADLRAVCARARVAGPGTSSSSSSDPTAAAAGPFLPVTIQLIFLYNSGNATILCADVESAMSIRALLLGMAARGGASERERQRRRSVDNYDDATDADVPACFEGLACTYSRDPCEMGEPLNLLSSLHGV